MSKPVILSIGAAVQDVFLSQSDAFAPVCIDPEHCFAQLEMGAKADVNHINFSTGGGAMNGAVTFARQGLESIFAGKIGHDPAGDAVVTDLDKENVNASYMAYSKKYNTGYSVILLANSGERTILTYRGASTHYRVENFTGITELSPDWLFLSTLSGNFEVLEFLIKWAAKNEIKVAFNPGKKELADPKRLHALLQHLTILNANKEEMEQLFTARESDALVREAATIVPYVVLTDGPRGAVATDGKVVVKAGMYEDVPVLDRTGAGDAFVSGFTAQIAREKTLQEALIFASANSTSVVGHIGAKAGILHEDAPLHDMPLEVEPL